MIRASHRLPAAVLSAALVLPVVLPAPAMAAAPAGAIAEPRPLRELGRRAELAVKLTASEPRIRRATRETLAARLDGHVVEIAGFEQTTSPGDPALPVQEIDVALPPDVDWSTLQLTVTKRGAQVLPGRFDVLPAPPRIVLAGQEPKEEWGPGKEIEAGRNRRVYGTNRFTPAETVRLVSRSQLGTWRFVRLEFFPVQYNPVKKTLRHVPSADVLLTFARTGATPPRAQGGAGRWADRLAEARFANHAEAATWWRAAEPAPAADYVIVTTNAIVAATPRLAEFVAHKTSRGHAVKVVTEDDYGALAGAPPDGRAEKIRRWLVDNHERLGIEYVLLVGDPDPETGDVPMKRCWPSDESTWGNDGLPTDYYFADLTGNWDLNGNGRHCQYEDHAATPDPSIPPGPFSIRWTGRLDAPVTGSSPFEYELFVSADHGVRVAIGGAIVLDRWSIGCPFEERVKVALPKGQHDVVVEYAHARGGGAFRLEWHDPQYRRRMVVPAERLLHLKAGRYVPGGLDAEIFRDEGLTSLAARRVDPKLDFAWGAGDLPPGGVDLSPEVYVGRIPVHGADGTLEAILEKAIRYESGPAPAWRRRILSAQAALGYRLEWSGFDVSEALRKDVAAPLGYGMYRAYESEFTSSGVAPPPECPKVNFKSADPRSPCSMLGEWVNGGGYGLVLWGAHGTARSAEGLIDASDAARLDDSRPAFTFQASCSNGHPESRDNLAHALLARGAIGTVSATRAAAGTLTHGAFAPNPLDGSAEQLEYHFAERLLAGEPVAKALYGAKSRVAFGRDAANVLGFNLYGDPALSLASGSPEPRAALPSGGP